jgi:hypothetical protein
MNLALLPLELWTMYAYLVELEFGICTFIVGIGNRQVPYTDFYGPVVLIPMILGSNGFIWTPYLYEFFFPRVRNPYRGQIKE